MASVLSFPVGRTGTKARRRRGIPSGEPVTSLLGREERLTVLQCAVGGWERIVEESGEDRARDAFKVAAHQALRALNTSLAEDVGLDGSPSRPVLTATFRESDQTREALIAAVDLRAALASLGETDPPGVAFDVRIGVHTAGVVDLVVGGADPMPFRAVGSLFALAARLQEAAEPGQILLSADTLSRAQTIATAHSLGEIPLNDHGETREAFCLLGLQVEDGA